MSFILLGNSQHYFYINWKLPSSQSSYPSGRPAVVVVAAGFGHPGYYTIAYDDDSEMKMLVCFTPSGHGVLYHSNGNVRFMANKKGGHIAESSGRIEKRWKWPPGGVKLIVPISFQVRCLLVQTCSDLFI